MINKNRWLASIYLILLPFISSAQEKALDWFLRDSVMKNSSVSLCILNSSTGDPVFQFEPFKSLIPASILKTVTSAAALELLGPNYRFKTSLGYKGVIKPSGKLAGDIIITGGGDPALGSDNFGEIYKDFLENWVKEIKGLGIKKIEGRVITDDSRYDFQPIPPRWLWEDAGNYYGAGAFGLSVFDNMYAIHFMTSEDGSIPEIKGFSPGICKWEFSNHLTASGVTDKAFIFRAPYSNYGWIDGSIPSNRQDFILKGSISDPPLLLARILTIMLDSAGIEVSGDPVSTRIIPGYTINNQKIFSELISPPVKEIVNILNHESVNLYAEHLLKEMGYLHEGKGTTVNGIKTVLDFLRSKGISKEGIYMEDGSGLSPMNAINASAIASLLLYMKLKSACSAEFLSSLPEPGKEGTLKNYFTDEIFRTDFRAKSGSMTRVRSFAGYFKTLSGNEMTFAVIVNNYSGPSGRIIKGIEEILMETIINK